LYGAMKLLSWNVRGLGRLQTVNRLRKKLRAINPRILFLIETKLSSKKMEMVRLKCGFSNGIDIGAVGLKGGLSLGWTGNDLVSIRSYSMFHMDADIYDPENKETWRLTGFYGSSDECYQRESWDLLFHLGYDQSVPWLVFGDFNEIVSSFKKKGGRVRSEGQIAEFKTTLEDCLLNDVGCVGRWFTWEKGIFLSTNIRERLDRGVATLNWRYLFPGFLLEHLSHLFSDHCPILLDTMGKLRHGKRRESNLFYFEAKWCLDNLFEETVRHVWANNHGSIPTKA
ncbi:hypothetical protein J1N35_006968, partial [Gossypium stocksii]